MDNQKNTILAVVLSGLVLLAWQYFVANPQMEKQRQIAQEQAEKRTPSPTTPGAVPQQQQPSQAQQPPQAAPGAPQPPAQPGATPPATTTAPVQPVSRDSIIAAGPRVRISTPTLSGSIALKGGRVDDLSLVKYREKVDPKSPAIILLSPSGSQDPLYAEFGWVGSPGATAALPGPDTEWKQEGSGALGVGQPVTLAYDNGAGLQFRRTIAVDEKYLFTVTDEVANKGTAPVTLFPYSLISRHGTPHTLGYYILHEGLIGVLGDHGLQEITYADVEKKKEMPFDVTNGWLGITDKY